MRSTAKFALLLAQVLVVTCQLEPILDSSTETFVKQVLADWQSPTGIAIALVRRDAQGQWLVETGGYGRASVDGSKGVTANTRLSIGSNSKLFTAIATGLLTKDPRVTKSLTWTSKLKDVVPGWGLVDELASNEAVVQDLLSHRTGVPSHDAAIKTYDTNADLIRKVRYHQPSTLFRNIWQYNNDMYRVLATFASTLLPSHQPHAGYVKENVFDKLGLTNTTYSFAIANSTGNMADGISRDFTGGKVTFRATPYWNADSGEDGNTESGPAGIISTAADLTIWLQTLLLNGVNPSTNQSVIPPDILQRAATGFSIEPVGQLPEISPVVYGAGQEIGSYRGYGFIEHTGAVAGYNSVVSRYPSSNYAVAILSNDSELGEDIVRVIQYHLADRVLGLDPIDWDTRIRKLVSSPSAPTTTRLANATFPYGDFSKLEGVYYDPGYGKAEFCYMNAAGTNSSTTIQGSSDSCNALRANVSTILPGVVKPGGPTFIATWYAKRLSHVTLRHFDGGLFNISACRSYPTGNSSAPFWAQDLGISGFGETDSELSGLGFTGIWGSVPGVPEPTGNTPKERAEVWFART